MQLLASRTANKKIRTISTNYKPIVHCKLMVPSKRAPPPQTTRDRRYVRTLAFAIMVNLFNIYIHNRSIKDPALHICIRGCWSGTAQYLGRVLRCFLIGTVMIGGAGRVACVWRYGRREGRWKRAAPRYGVPEKSDNQQDRCRLWNRSWLAARVEVFFQVLGNLIWAAEGGHSIYCAAQ